MKSNLKKLEYIKNWQKENKDKCNLASKRRIQELRFYPIRFEDYILRQRKYQKAFRLKYPEKVRVTQRKYMKKYYLKTFLKVKKKNPNKKINRCKTRFLIFKRDNFTCQYCGRKAPEIKLEVDHIQPKSKNGLDIVNNYITSCRECNIGKSDILLDLQLENLQI